MGNLQEITPRGAPEVSQGRSARRKRVLLLCNYDPTIVAETILEHIRSFKDYSEHDVFTINFLGDLPDEFPIHIFDVVVIHYSVCIGRGGYLSQRTKDMIREHRGCKVLFIQDDYRWINSTISNCLYMGIDIIFGLASQRIKRQIYPEEILPNVRIETVLTGYVSDALLQEKSKEYAKRTIDVSYRARKLPFWMGSFALQKWQIADRFLEDTKPYNLHCDISTKEEDRLYGNQWINLLKNSKAVLGTESGVNVCDFTGQLQKDVEAYEKINPNATFEEVKSLFLKDEDDRIRMNVISPRIFEAISCKALLILYPGEYNGILIPWQHYVPLNKDHSNIDEVMETLQSPEKAEAIINRAYEEILCNGNYHYRSLISLFDQVLDEELSKLSYDDDYITEFQATRIMQVLQRATDKSHRIARGYNLKNEIVLAKAYTPKQTKLECYLRKGHAHSPLIAKSLFLYGRLLQAYYLTEGSFIKRLISYPYNLFRRGLVSIVTYLYRTSKRFIRESLQRINEPGYRRVKRFIYMIRFHYNKLFNNCKVALGRELVVRPKIKSFLELKKDGFLRTDFYVSRHTKGSVIITMRCTLTCEDDSHKAELSDTSLKPLKLFAMANHHNKLRVKVEYSNFSKAFFDSISNLTTPKFLVVDVEEFSHLNC
jgi:hypothetical protein